MEVYPSILEQNKKEIESKLQRLGSLTNQVQIDICDGVFVPSKTYGSRGLLKSLQTIRKMTRTKDLELDLMVDFTRTKKRKDWLAKIASIKPDRVIIHYGSTDRWGSIFRNLTKQNKLVAEVGLGVHLHHRNQDIYELLESYPFSFVQVMGIERVGYKGQKFSYKTYSKIRSIRKHYPKMPISVDGGVKITNAQKLKDAGATRLCPNSGLFGVTVLKEQLRQFNP